MGAYEVYEAKELSTWRNISMIYLNELCSEPIWVNSYFYNSDILRK